VWRAVVLCIALLGAGASVTAAAPLKLRDAGSIEALVRADGVRYIATADFGGPVSVLDTSTRARDTFAPPPGCAFADMHRGTLLWNCPGSVSAFGTGKTLDTASGQASVLPALTRMPESFVDQAIYQAIGDRWAVVTQFGYHIEHPVYVDRVDGRPHPDFVQRRDRIVNLDDPPLTHTLCRGQIRPLVPDAPDGSLIPGQLVTHGRWAAATSYREDHAGKQTARVELQRCAAKTRVLRICRRVQCSSPVINGRLVAWTETRPAAFPKPATGRVVVRRVHNGRQRVSQWKTTTLTPLLVGRRLYVTTADGRLLRAAL
jgi:hypothetical protein